MSFLAKIYEKYSYQLYNDNYSLCLIFANSWLCIVQNHAFISLAKMIIWIRMYNYISLIFLIIFISCRIYVGVHVLHYACRNRWYVCFRPPMKRRLVPSDVSHWLFPQNSIWVPRKLGPAEFFADEKIHREPDSEPPRFSSSLSIVRVKSARGWSFNRVSHMNQSIKCAHPLDVICAYVISHWYFIINRIKISNRQCKENKKYIFMILYNIIEHYIWIK